MSISKRRPLSPTPKLFTSKMHTVSVPINGVSPKGQGEVIRLLDTLGLPRVPEGWDWSWKVAKGEYAGTLPKRIARFLHREHKIKLSNPYLANIGTVASQFVFSQDKFFIDFTNNINWTPTQFAETNDCCFWGCRALAKNMILENGGRAIRFYRGAHKSDGGIGRAWIVPLDNSSECDEELIFNGYGLSLLDIVRIYSHFKGSIYEKVYLTNNESWEKTLWINGGVGYIVGPSNKIAGITQCKAIDMRLREWQKCDWCSNGFPEEKMLLQIDSRPMCFACVDKRYYACEDCNSITYSQISEKTMTLNRGTEDEVEKYVCNDCLNEKYLWCTFCDNWYDTNNVKTFNKKHYCQECYDIKLRKCDCCNDVKYNEDLLEIYCGIKLCKSCLPRRNQYEKCASTLDECVFKDDDGCDHVINYINHTNMVGYDNANFTVRMS